MPLTQTDLLTGRLAELAEELGLPSAESADALYYKHAEAVHVPPTAPPGVKATYPRGLSDFPRGSAMAEVYRREQAARATLEATRQQVKDLKHREDITASRMTLRLEDVEDTQRVLEAIAAERVWPMLHDARHRCEKAEKFDEESWRHEHRHLSARWEDYAELLGRLDICAELLTATQKDLENAKGIKAGGLRRQVDGLTQQKAQLEAQLENFLK